jgi:hypothetical protein
MNRLDWDDLHNQLLNWTYSLYRKEYREIAYFANERYLGCPDPSLNISDGSKRKGVTPDFIATNGKEIVQIHDIKGFEGSIHWSSDDNNETSIREKLKKIKAYENISRDSIITFFQKYGKQLNNFTIELVVVLDFRFYSRYPEIFDKCAKQLGIIVWTIDIDQYKIRKHVGRHIDKNIEKIFSGKHGLPIVPRCPDIILMTRQTNRDLRRFHFTANLISFFCQESKKVVKFDEIDDIMVNSRPPKFEYLTFEERKHEWEALLFDAVEHSKIFKRSSTSRDTYELHNPAILESPYLRHKILEELANKRRVSG